MKTGQEGDRISHLPGAGAQVPLATNVPLHADATVEAAVGRDAHVGLQETPDTLQEMPSLILFA